MTAMIGEEPDVMEMLRALTPEEQAILMPVLERDLEFQRRERQRLRDLRSSVDSYKSDVAAQRSSSMLSSRSQESFSSGVMSTSPSPSSPSPSTRACTHCAARLGFILGSGKHCKRCDQLICDGCRRFISPSRSAWLCPICFKERELLAASGEWVNKLGTEEEETSQKLLRMMRRVSTAEKIERPRSTQPSPNRAPPIARRNMTLPSLGLMSNLTVPTEAEVTEHQRESVTRRFWGGSPSPRSPSPRPLSAASQGVTIVAPTPPPSHLSPGPQMHPREIIGSPAPRSAPPLGSGPMHLPLTEVAIEAPTPTAMGPPSPVAELRRQAFVAKSSRSFNENYLLPVDQRDLRRSSTTSCPSEDSAMRKGTEIISRIDPQIPRPRSLNMMNEYGTKGRILPRLELDDEWVQYKRPPVDSKSRDNVSRLIVQIDGNGNERRRSSSSVVSSRMRRSASRDTDTISLASTCDDYRISVNVASQVNAPIHFLGEVNLLCNYEPSTGCLRVRVIQCRSLPGFGQHKPNPYVKVTLLGERGDDEGWKQKTRKKHAETEPVFDEVLQFTNLTMSSIQQRQMIVSVWHYDSLSRNSCMGEGRICLSDLSWHRSRPIWLPLEAKASPQRAPSSFTGEMVLVLRLVRCSDLEEDSRGSLEVEINSLRLPFQSTVKTRIFAVIKLYNSEKRLGRSVSPQVTHMGNEEIQWNWKTRFGQTDIHQIHLKTLKISVRKPNGAFGYKILTETSLNEFLHRKGRSVSDPCGCVRCRGWQTLCRPPFSPQKVILPLTLFDV